ncbi:hypothetical protein [Reinekea blandensis]|uniref:hypothetical protein n=1 Tax=Reinekea blandensis TaxID=374838 RepID=UPI000325787F|nr:hypothetical protein [Reinekea blandensis]
MEQFEIVKRYFKRLEAIYEGVQLSPGYNRECYDDDVMSFFIHCYHVRDWLIHDENFNISSREVDEYIDTHRALSVCTDLANGLKHCRLTRRTRTENQPHVSGRERLTSKFGDELSVMSCKYRVMSSNENIDALDLAKECVRLWDDFIIELA